MLRYKRLSVDDVAVALTKTNYKTDECRKRSRHRFSPAWLIHILIYYLRRIAFVFRKTLNGDRRWIH